MHIRQCDSCKKQFNQTTQYSEVQDMQEFNVNTGTATTPAWQELHICGDCFKKVLQFLHIEW